MRGAIVPLCVLALLATVAGPTPMARAQPTDPRQTEAHALFASGREAAEAGLWSEAVVRFTRSYDLFPTASALYNLAVALRALGRHIEARDALSRLLSEHAADLADEQRRDAQELLAAESLRTARLTLAGLPAATRFELVVDEARREDTGERPLTLELDPGDHRLSLRDEAFEPFSWEGTLVEGQRLELRLSLEPVRQAPDEDRGSVLSSPWFWLAAGAVVIGAGAVAAWVWLFDTDRVEPLSDRRYRL